MPLSSHPCLPFCWNRCKTAGPLRSTDITPLRRYCRPVRHPLAFPDFPVYAGYTGSCSVDFSPGRGGLLQLLGASLSSCCRYRPARVFRRIGQFATFHAAFALSTGARPLRRKVSRSPMRLLPLRPNDSLTIPRMALSIDSRGSVSFPPGYPSYRALTFALVGLPPTEYTSLRWTCVDNFSSPCFSGCSLSARPSAGQTACARLCPCLG